MVIYGICLLLNRNQCKQVLYSSNVINLGLCVQTRVKIIHVCCLNAFSTVFILCVFLHDNIRTL